MQPRTGKFTVILSNTQTIMLCPREALTRSNLLKTFINAQIVQVRAQNTHASRAQSPYAAHLNSVQNTRAHPALTARPHNKLFTQAQRSLVGNNDAIGV